MINIKPPLVSIITPSFNQGRFIKETIESVLTQDYPNIEHIVIDGGSNDNTLEILQTYAKKDSRFQYVSEPDRGQSHAINKGVEIAKGELIGWLNSDDTYLPGAIKNSVEAFNNNPDWSVVYGKAYITDENNKRIKPYPVKTANVETLFKTCSICQPSAFIKKDILTELGGIDESLDFCMDYDLWIKAAKKGYKFGLINPFLANTRFYPDSKTGSRLVDVGFPEIIKTSIKYFNTVSNTWINFFLKNYRNKGVFWFLKLFKTYSIFGISPKIINTNKLDSFSPRIFTFSTLSHPTIPLHSLLIRGHQEKFNKLSCKTYLNGKLINQTTILNGPFVLNFPVSAKGETNHFKLLFNKSFNYENNEVSTFITDILPLSEEEYRFFLEYRKSTKNATNWINQHLKSTPDFSLY